MSLLPSPSRRALNAAYCGAFLLGASAFAQEFDGEIHSDPTPPVFHDDATPKPFTPPSPIDTSADVGVEVAQPQRVSMAQSLDKGTLSGEHPTQALVGAFDELIFDTTAAEGRVFVRGGHWKADFGPHGLRYTPVLGKAAPQNFTTSFELESVTVGGESLHVGRGSATRQRNTIAIDRGTLREVYQLDVNEIEQTFVFDSLPGGGDLSLELDVDSPWTVVPGADQIRFVDPTWGEVTYGRAYVLDAAGRVQEISREWTGDGIELRVPASFLSTAVFPVTVDPIIGSTITNTFGTTDDDRLPDTAFDANTFTYFVVWQDYTSALDVDVYATQISSGGTQGSIYSIDITPDYWATPAVAACQDEGRVLVVASVSPDGPGTGTNANIDGRIIDTNAAALLGAAFTIDQTGFDCVAPDVGGTSGVTGLQEFCVVWERVFSPTDHDILARQVEANGSLPNATIFLSNSGSDNDFAPAISKSWGDHALNGDFWNVAWIRDDDGNGRGTPFAHRIYRDGSSNGSSEFQVFTTALASNVDVTSTFNDTLGTTGKRPFLVSYERAVSGNDVYVAVCTQNESHSNVSIGLTEDFDVTLAQIEPSIATDGTSFLLTYSELFWNTGGTTDYDTYMVSGGISETFADGYIALAERHVNMAFSGTGERASAVTSQFDGGGTTDDGLAVWVDRNGTNGGTLEMARLDIDTLEGSSNQAVGRQYCEANAHGDSTAGGRRSSWLRVLGDQSVNSTHYLYCEEMKLNAFAYFIGSNTSGNVNMPGNSMGRLCLGGNIGRVVGGSILHTGTSGSINASFNPLALPSPTGTVSASAGETWYFQCWHRDSQGGVSTSNFSNACAVTFQN